jgi:hypothetical protein
VIVKVEGPGLRRALLRTGQVGAGAMLLVVPVLVRLWLRTGNPVYPFDVSSPGLHFAGNDLYALIRSTALYGTVKPSYPDLFRILFVPGLWHGRDETGLGPALPLLLIPSVLGAVACVRAQRGARSVAFLAGLAVLSAAPFFTPSGVNFRTGSKR